MPTPAKLTNFNLETVRMKWSSDCSVRKHENDNRCFPAVLFFQSSVFSLQFNMSSNPGVFMQRGSEVLQSVIGTKKKSCGTCFSEYLKGGEKKINKNQFNQGLLIEKSLLILIFCCVTAQTGYN